MKRRRVLSLVADGPALIRALSFHPVPLPAPKPVIVKSRGGGYFADFETYSGSDLYPYQREALEAMDYDYSISAQKLADYIDETTLQSVMQNPPEWSGSSMGFDTQKYRKD